MSVATQIARIKDATATIRSKYVELGIAQSTDKIDELADASEQIENKGAVTATVSEGTTYTIPKGYHNGSGTVTGVAPAADATVKTWETPDMTSNTDPSPYNITSNPSSDDIWKLFDGNLDTNWDSGSTGLNDANPYKDVKIIFEFGRKVTVSAIRFMPTTGKLDLFPSQVSIGYRLNGTDVESMGNQVPDNIVEGEWWTIRDSSFVVECDSVAITLETVANNPGEISLSEIEFETVETVGKYSLQSAKVITPTTKQQNITPDDGFYGLAGVTINPIPSNYKDVSVVSATSDDVLLGKTIVDAQGNIAVGSMPNNGAISQTIDGLTVTSVVVPAGYTSGGTVSLDDTIEQALADI